jgi:hypothetical protein
MKRLLAVLAAVTLAVGLSGCETVENTILQEQINGIQAQIDILDVEPEEEVIDYYTIEEIDAILLEQAPTRVERWTQSMFLEAMTDGSMEFVELGDTIVYNVESYGYSPTYILEIMEATTVQFEVAVDNDLEFCYYPTTMFGDDMACTDLKPDSMWNDGNYVFTIVLEPGFFEFDFESWDDINDSILNITISEVISNE